MSIYGRKVSLWNALVGGWSTKTSIQKNCYPTRCMWPSVNVWSMGTMVNVVLSTVGATLETMVCWLYVVIKLHCEIETQNCSPMPFVFLNSTYKWEEGINLTILWKISGEQLTWDVEWLFIGCRLWLANDRWTWSELGRFVRWTIRTAGRQDWLMDPRVDETWANGSLISRRVRSDSGWGNKTTSRLGSAWVYGGRQIYVLVRCTSLGLIINFW